MECEKKWIAWFHGQGTQFPNAGCALLSLGCAADKTNPSAISRLRINWHGSNVYLPIVLSVEVDTVGTPVPFAVGSGFGYPLKVAVQNIHGFCHSLWENS